MLWNKRYPQTLTNPRNHNHKTKHNHKTHTTTLRQRNGERKKKKKKNYGNVQLLNENGEALCLKCMNKSSGFI
jgi:hypothetical protein